MVAEQPRRFGRQEVRQKFPRDASVAASFQEFGSALVRRLGEERSDLAQVFGGEEAAPAFVSRQNGRQVLLCLVQAHVLHLLHALGLPLDRVEGDVARAALRHQVLPRLGIVALLAEEARDADDHVPGCALPSLVLLGHEEVLEDDFVSLA